MSHTRRLLCTVLRLSRPRLSGRGFLLCHGISTVGYTIIHQPGAGNHTGGWTQVFGDPTVVSECFMNLGTIVDREEKIHGPILPHPPRRQCLYFCVDGEVKRNLQEVKREVQYLS